MADAATVEKTADNRNDATKLQDRTVGGIVASLKEGRDAFLYGPTGVGKSRMFSCTAAECVEDGLKVLVLSHRQNLVLQGQRSMEKWVSAPIETTRGMDGHIDESGQVVYSTIQTAHEMRDKLQKYDVVVIDEAHHALEKSREYAETIEAIIRKNPKALFVGASATPPEEYKGLHPRLKGSDKHIITYKEAIDAKLVRLPKMINGRFSLEGGKTIDDIVEKHHKSTRSTQLHSGISKAVGEARPDDWAYVSAQMYDRHLSDRKTLAFFDRVDDAKAFMKEINENFDAKAGIIYAEQGKSKNDTVKESFEKNELQILCSIGMISEGYDIDCTGILLDRKTTSETEFKQIIGRGSRGHADEGEPALLIDLGASTRIHGDIFTMAEMQGVRAGIEKGEVTPKDLLPGAKALEYSPWVRVPGQEGQPEIWGTTVAKKVVYVHETDKGYIAFQSKEGKGKIKEPEVQFLDDVVCEKRGRPTQESMTEWVAKHMFGSTQSRKGELFRSQKGEKNKLQNMIDDDWRKTGESIIQKIGMMVGEPMSMPAMAMSGRGMMAMQNSRGMR